MGMYINQPLTYLMENIFYFEIYTYTHIYLHTPPPHIWLMSTLRELLWKIM